MDPLCLIRLTVLRKSISCDSLQEDDLDVGDVGQRPLAQDGHQEGAGTDHRQSVVREGGAKAETRVLAFDLPLTHYSHIGRRRQLAGGLYQAVQWLF